MDEKIFLIVDPDLEFARRLGSSIGNEGRVESVDSGLSLLWKMAKGLRPALIFLDLSVPSPHAFEILQYLKSSAELRQIPVVVTSRRPVPEEAEIALAMGAGACLCKETTSLEFFRALIRQLCRAGNESERPFPKIMLHSQLYQDFYKNSLLFNNL